MPIYMLIEGISGDSTARNYENWLEINSFQWGVTDHISNSAGNGNGGRLTKSEITVTLAASKASPLLFLDCCLGKRFATATFAFTRASSERTFEFERYVAKDVLIGSYSTSSGGDVPIETLSLFFSALESIYNAAEVVTTHFDFATLS